MQDFIFVNLSAQAAGAKPFDGMAAGTFIDKWGRGVTFEKSELAEYIANTRENILATLTDSGEIVGLPIDQRNHDGTQDAAGWIVDVELAESGDKIRFTPRWTDIGRELIGSGKMRFFSPTVATDEKVIVGGSLTNWPASRGNKYKNLLKPIEMSMSDETITNADTENLFTRLTGWFERIFERDELSEPAPVAEITEGALSMPEPAEMVSPPVELTAEQIARIDLEVNSRVEAALALKARETRTAEFARNMVGRGFPAEAPSLAAFLASLTAEQSETAEGIISRVVEVGLIPLAELGHAQTMTGTKPLPEWAGSLFRDWIGRKLPADEFFKINAAELGARSDYNLTEYMEGNNG